MLAMAGRNLKILGHGEVRWNFFQMRPFEKGRSLILLASIGLEQSRVLWARILYCYA
jgi:hypothetical protein